jgi:glycine betaine/proline transport system ATP-binding protein
MCERERMPADGGALWLDDARRYRLSLNAAQEALGLHFDGVQHALRHIADDSAGEAALADQEPGLVVVPASFSLQTIIRLRQRTGHPVLLAEGGRIVGVCGEAEIIRALAGSRH